MATTKYLTDDLIREILIKLPAKSLIRFRGVCKSWRAIISREDFIGSHLRQSRNKSTLTTFDLLLILQHRFTNNFYVVRYNQLRSDKDIYSPHSSFRICPPPRDELVTGCPYYWLTTIGFCDGIVCLQCDETTIIICNPSMRKSATISAPFELSKNLDLVYYGFGHDARSDDYKIVRLHFKRDSKNVEVHVYSLKSLTWRPIANDLSDFRYVDDEACLAGGHFHWVAYSGEAKAHLLLSFDLTHEVFRQMELPLRSDPDLFYDLIPTTAAEHCKVYLHAWGCEGVSSVWELGELGVAGSWTELHPTARELIFGYKVLGLENRTTGRFVIHSCGNGVVNSTEVECGVVKNYCCLDLCENETAFCGFANYMESLVMLSYGNS